jgi:hypothetical protein
MVPDSSLKCPLQLSTSLHSNKKITSKDNKDFGPPTAFHYHTAGDACAIDAVNVTDGCSLLVVARLRHS